MVKSISYLVFISAIVGCVPFAFYSKYSMIMYCGVFVIACGLQFVSQYILNAFIEGKYAVQVREKERQIIEEMTRFERDLVCPCFQKKNQTVTVRPDADTDYKCDFCKKDVRAKTDIITVMVTKPVDELKGPASLIQ